METRRIQNIKQRDEMLRKLGFKKVQCLTDKTINVYTYKV